MAEQKNVFSFVKINISFLFQSVSVIIRISLSRKNTKMGATSTQNILSYVTSCRLNSGNFRIFDPSESMLIINSSVRAFEIVQNDIKIGTFSWGSTIEIQFWNFCVGKSVGERHDTKWRMNQKNFHTLHYRKKIILINNFYRWVVFLEIFFSLAPPCGGKIWWRYLMAQFCYLWFSFALKKHNSCRIWCFGVRIGNGFLRTKPYC